MITIRRATRKDLPAWRAMRQTLFDSLDDEFQRAEMELYLDGEDKGCLLAFDLSQADAIGLVEVSLRNIVDGCITSPVGYIEALWVEPAMRGCGTGRRLVEEAIAWLEAKGCAEIATDSLLDDESAQSFHRRMGFEETYRVVQFKLKR